MTRLHSVAGSGESYKMPELAVYEIEPMAKPRLTRGDSITMSKLRQNKRLNTREAKRAKLLGRWLGYCDEVQIRGVRLDLDEFYHVIFCIRMPRSWSEARRREHDFTRHRSRPDRDNLDKALMDACHAEDCYSADARISKLWTRHGAIIVSRNSLPLDGSLIRGILEESNYGKGKRASR